jgi:UDP-N-acetylglucosamine acyltransferase
VNIVGLRRGGFTPEERQQIRKAFALLYRSGLNISQATARIRETFPSGPALEMCSFVEQSRRGVCRFESDEEPADEEQGT